MVPFLHHNTVCVKNHVVEILTPVEGFFFLVIVFVTVY